MQTEHPYAHQPAPGEVERAAIAVLVLVVAVVALCIFGPRHDPTKVIIGMPCSVVSEAEIGRGLGTPVQLMPSNGTICRYVPTNLDDTQSLYVIAQSSSVTNEPPGPGIGSSGANTVVAHGRTHRYTIRVINAAGDQRAAYAAEERIAKLIQRPIIAANR